MKDFDPPERVRLTAFRDSSRCGRMVTPRADFAVSAKLLCQYRKQR